MPPGALNSPLNRQGVYNTPVGSAIFQATTDPRTRLAMLMGAMLEGGSLVGGWRPGDNGTSFGPFQMHIGGALTAEGGNRTLAENPKWATDHMVDRYQSGVFRVPAGMWQTDPSHAAALAAFYAEHPKNMYDSQRISGAWSLLNSKNVGGGLGNIPGNLAGAVGKGIGAIGRSPIINPIGAAMDAITSGFGVGSIKEWAIRGGLIIFGGLIIIIGLFIMFQKQVEEGVGTVAGAAVKSP